MSSRDTLKRVPCLLEGFYGRPMAASDSRRCTPLCRALGGSGGAVSWLEGGNLHIEGCNAPWGRSPILLNYDASPVNVTLTSNATANATLTASRDIPVDAFGLILGNYTLTFQPNASLTHVLPQRFVPPSTAKPLNWTLPAASLRGLLANDSAVR